MNRWASFVALVAAAVLASCSPSPAPPPGETKPGPTPTIQRTSLGEMPDIDTDQVLAHTRELSADAFQGRAPGTEGEDLTVSYLVEQFRAMGLRTGNPVGAFTQRVSLVGITAEGQPLVLRKGAEERSLAWKDDVVAWSKHVAPTVSIDDSELVFVGYGIVAPEYDWDDYKDLDVKGKTLVMLIGDPPVANPENPSDLDPKTFGGRAMTYYGRWTYKFEIAAEKGAAGALIVHDTAAAGYPFSVVQTSNLAEKFDLVTPDKNMGRAAIEGWITNEQSRSLMAWSGQDFDQLSSLAATRDFKPVPLGVTATMTINNKVRTLESRNVVARIDGRDPELRDEFVMYTAHWDHLGVGAAVNGDRIYNGAKDNAIGVAGMLEIARAFTKLPAPPKRSILFMATTAEEQGLLGSAFYVLKPLYPFTQTVASINIDGLNVHGRTRDLTVVGYGSSDLDDYARDATGEQGRVIRPDPEPEKGMYYRSDHFNLARQGVPSLYTDEGVEFIGRPADYARALREDWTTHDYHQPTDVIKRDWDLSGAREDLKVLFAVGYRVAEANARPGWKPGSEFKNQQNPAPAK